MFTGNIGESTASDEMHDENVRNSADIRQALSSEGFTRDKGKVSLPPVVSRAVRCKDGSVTVSFLPAGPHNPLPAFVVAANGMQHELPGLRACRQLLADIRNGNLEGELSKVTTSNVEKALLKFGFTGKQSLDEAEFKTFNDFNDVHEELDFDAMSLDRVVEGSGNLRAQVSAALSDFKEGRDYVYGSAAKSWRCIVSPKEASRRELLDALRDAELEVEEVGPDGADGYIGVMLPRVHEAAPYSAFWGKEQIKWLDVIEHQATNLATAMMWLRQWAPTQPKYAQDRAKVAGHLQRMREAADLLSSTVDEVSDFLKDSLFDRNNYMPRG